MAKLYFKYGTMKSGKTLDLIRTYDSYTVTGRNVLVITPSLDDRYGVGKVKSRLGVEIKSFPFEVNTLQSILGLPILDKFDIILVDEAQFFSAEDITTLRDISINRDIPVIAYGLKTTFQGELFEGSKALLEMAEDISEIKSVCNFCSSKAIMNLRLDNGEPVYTGDVVQLGDSDYVPVCYKHYMNPKEES